MTPYELEVARRAALMVCPPGTGIVPLGSMTAGYDMAMERAKAVVRREMQLEEARDGRRRG